MPRVIGLSQEMDGNCSEWPLAIEDDSVQCVHGTFLASMNSIPTWGF